MDVEEVNLVSGVFKFVPAAFTVQNHTFLSSLSGRTLSSMFDSPNIA